MVVSEMHTQRTVRKDKNVRSTLKKKSAKAKIKKKYNNAIFRVFEGKKKEDC